MRIGIYDPYLDTIGGGERYCLTIAECLARKGHQVDIFWDDEGIKKDLEERLGLNLAELKFVDNIFYSRKNFVQKWQITRKYDAIFYLSDGSIPFLFAKKNILHFQVPFQNIGGRSFLNKLKLKKIDRVVCNSGFTKGFIDKEFGVKSSVVYPPVAVKEFKPGKKKNIILAVGRFSKALHAKKQEVLIEVFKNLYKKKLNGWQLLLAGGLKEEDEDYFNCLKRKVHGLPIEFFANVGFKKLRKLYGQAKIFWHAAGYGEDEERNPERMEHFGIVVVEAMAAGCVPVVIGKGGIPEIVKQGGNGFLWRDKKELENRTLQLAKSPQKMKKVSLQAIKASKKFSKEIFCQKNNELFEN